MEIAIRPDTNAACNLVADIIANAISEKPDLVLGLATGRTMEQLYARLAEMHRNDGLDFSRCRTFNLDEFIGLPVEHPGSYRYYMNHHLFNNINIDPANTFLPDGMAADIKAGCAAYEQKIAECGGIDLQLLGIGADGHIGFNEPLSSLCSRTRDKTLDESTIKVNSTLFDNPDEMPRSAITMGVGTILDARSIVLLATGKSKAGIIAQAVEGPVTSMVTASALQFHQKCRIVVDEDAAAKLQHHNYYRWIFNHDPDWAKYRTTL